MVGGRAHLTPAPPPPPEEQEALLLLRLLPGVGDRAARRLLRAGFPSRTALLEGVARGRVEAPPAAREALRRPELRRQVAGWVRRAGELGIRILGVDEPGYPSRLFRLHDPPAVLYLRGRERLAHGPVLAMVGSRRVTATGRRVAEAMAEELSTLGVTVASGMALGIDGAAHRGALRGEGSSIGVVGRGLDRPYPLDHADLFRQLSREGLLVSEFPPGTGARPHHFPRRNRVLAALSFGVVAVEAGERSGALITVDHALDMGIEVMVAPGAADLPSTRGTNRLARDGAHLVTSAREVLESLGVVPPPPPTRGLEGRRAPPVELPPAQRQLFADPGTQLLDSASAPGSEAWTRLLDAETLRVVGCLGTAPVPVEAVLERAGLPPSRTLSILGRLEMEGRVTRAPEGWLLASRAA
jgi:DNA processing protein